MVVASSLTAPGMIPAASASPVFVNASSNLIGGSRLNGSNSGSLSNSPAAAVLIRSLAASG